MLMIPAYHRASGRQRSSNSPSMLKAHLELIANRYPVVLPGEPLEKGRLSICLTFDDAYCDFYYTVYPLLKKYRLRAILAVPTAYIQKTTQKTKEARMEELEKFWSFDTPPSRDIFCTFEELKEMSEWVQCASHTHTHPKTPPTEEEMILSKKILEKETLPVNTLIYPYGKVNRETQKMANEHYSYQMRLGSALNLGWSKQMLFRNCCDSLITPNDPFTKSSLMQLASRGMYKKISLRLFGR